MSDNHSKPTPVDPDLEPFINEFIEDRINEINLIRTDQGNQINFNDISRLTHKWKSFCQPYGFGKVVPNVIALEEAAKNKNNEKCADLVNQIHNYFLTESNLRK